MTDRPIQPDRVSDEDAALRQRYQAVLNACEPPKDLQDRIFSRAAAEAGGRAKTADAKFSARAAAGGGSPDGTDRPAAEAGAYPITETAGRPSAAQTAKKAAPRPPAQRPHRRIARRLIAAAAVLICAAGVVWIWQITGRSGRMSDREAAQAAVPYAAETAAGTEARPAMMADQNKTAAETKAAAAPDAKPESAPESKSAPMAAQDDAAAAAALATEADAAGVDAGIDGKTGTEAKTGAAQQASDSPDKDPEPDKASQAAARLTAYFHRDADEHIVYPTDYAGSYIEGNYLHVVVKDGRYGPFIDMIGDCSAVIFEPARYSQAELRVLMNDLMKERREHITSAGVDDRENRVRIGVYDLEAFSRDDAVRTDAAARFMAAHGLTSTGDLPLVLEERQPARAD